MKQETQTLRSCFEVYREFKLQIRDSFNFGKMGQILFQKSFICHFFRTGQIRDFLSKLDRNRYFSDLIMGKVVSNDYF